MNDNQKGLDKPQQQEYCDFCGKGREEVKSLVVGLRATICNECIDRCMLILKEEKPGGGL